jgi:hypothetical protein
MIETLGRNCRAALCLGENECALDDPLEVKREPFRRPIVATAVFAHCSANVGVECLGVIADVSFAGGTYIRVGSVGFLDDRARENT